MKIALIFCLLSSSVFAADNFLEFGDVNFGRDFKEKSKWSIKSGMSYIRYPSVFPEFDGVHENIDGNGFKSSRFL